MEQAHWYVVHTYSGYENKVAKNLMTIVENRRLQDWIHRVEVPIETVTDLKDGEEREVERKLFPGYVLVKMVMNDESWYIVRNTRGVTGFVGASSKPLPLTADEVDSLGVEKEDDEKPAATTAGRMDYEAGDNVMILGGSLEGFVGLVDSINKDTGKVHVTVSMFGRDTPAELDLNQVKPI